MPTPCWLKHPCSIRALVPVSFFLSLSVSLCLSVSLLDWSPGAQRLSEFTFLPGLLRLSREGALCLHPTERVPEASVNRTSPLSGTSLAFSVNQGISSSFSPLFSYLQLSFLLSLNQSLTPFLFQVSLDPAEAGPRCMNFYKVLGLKYTGRKD